MEEHQLEYFREILLDEKIRIEQNLRAIVSDLRDNAEQPSSDTIDEANAMNETAMSLRMKDRDKQLLQKIKLSLQRIENGDYGDCYSCEEPIDVKRLRIRPVTTLCIMCKEKQEKEESHFAFL